MMHKVYILFLSVILINGGLFPAYSQETRSKNDLPLELKYKVNVGFFHVGEGRLTVGKKTSYCDYAFDAEVWTTGLAKVISKIHYHFRSCINKETGWPMEAMRYGLKGKDESYEFVEFDHYSLADSTIFYGFNNDTITLMKDVYDMMSGLHHLYLDYNPNDFYKGQEILIKTYWTEEIYDLRVIYEGIEYIKTKQGEVRCHKYMPVTEIGDFFKTNRDVSIWVTDDDAYLPIRIIIDLKVGTLTGDLMNN